jgi:hypothetical protein
MANTSSSSSGGIGFFGLLTIVFIVLKLTSVIEWSWFWVLAPTWIPLLIVLAALVCIGLFFLGAKVLERGEKSS